MFRAGIYSRDDPVAPPPYRRIGREVGVGSDIFSDAIGADVDAGAMRELGLQHFTADREGAIGLLNWAYLQELLKTCPGKVGEAAEMLCHAARNRMEAHLEIGAERVGARNAEIGRQSRGISWPSLCPMSSRNLQHGLVLHFDLPLFFVDSAGAFKLATACKSLCGSHEIQSPGAKGLASIAAPVCFR